MRILSICLVFLLSYTPAFALDIQPVTQDVYALVGETEQRSKTNFANNATFGVIVTTDGIVLIDPGGSWKGAKQIHDTIKTISNQPIKFVINTGGQDHRWLGNDYWHKQGAKIIASEAAIEDQKERTSQQLSALQNFLGSMLDGTEPRYGDIRFEDRYSFTFGGLDIVIEHPAHAHTPGDSFVWVKQKNSLFSGDIIYIDRILGVGSQSNSKEWLSAFERIEAINPEYIIPGHGPVTDLATAKKQTYDYLVNIRQKIRAHLDEGGDMINAPKVDQSSFATLKQFMSLAGRNAQQVFSEMEWED